MRTPERDAAMRAALVEQTETHPRCGWCNRRATVRALDVSDGAFAWACGHCAALQEQDEQSVLEGILLMNGVNKYVYTLRIESGWSKEKAATTPHRPRKRGQNDDRRTHARTTTRRHKVLSA